jgi:hypothetical protein
MKRSLAELRRVAKTHERPNLSVEERADLIAALEMAAAHWRLPEEIRPERSTRAAQLRTMQGKHLS